MSRKFNYVLGRCLMAVLINGILCSLLLMATVLFINTASAASEQTATNSVQQMSDVGQGSLLLTAKQGFRQATLLSTDVQMEINAMLARVRVKQAFQNTDTSWQEGIYVFPLPENAAVDQMRLIIGERVIEGQIKEKQQARKAYQQARQSGRKASLVEQERPNIFTTSVANIAPGETVVVEIAYQQLVHYDDGRFSLRFPTVVAPRYIPGARRIRGFDGSGWGINTDEVPDASRVTPPVKADTTKTINPLNIHVSLDAGLALESISSPFHSIDYRLDDNSTRYRIALKENNTVADRDFVLRWHTRSTEAPAAALFKETFTDHEYALLMLMPPGKAQASQLPRELVFVVDTSGSMAGASIKQARVALEHALGSLNSGDRFNIIQFNSSTSRLFSDSMDVSSQSLHRARHYVRALNANGGTEMASAIRAALVNPARSSHLRQVVFITDGSVGNEAALFKLIKQLLGDSRLFTVGIGSAPNSHFMRRAAAHGRGTHTYIGDTAEVQEVMDDLFSKLNSPLLRDIQLASIDTGKLEMWPERIPDLYLGEPLLVTVRARQLPKNILVSGSLAGSDWQRQLPLAGGREADGVARLWARRKITALMDQNAQGSEADQIRQNIVDTALSHKLVSRYTSLVAVDVTPVRPQNAPLQSEALAVNLPAGWQYQKVFGVMPQTATPAGLYLLIGLVLTLLGFVPLRLRP